MFFSSGGGRPRPRDGVRFSFGGRLLPCDGIAVLWFFGPLSPPCGFVLSGNFVVTTATVAATPPFSFSDGEDDGTTACITFRDFLFLLPEGHPLRASVPSPLVKGRLREEDVDEARNFFFFFGFFSNVSDGDSVFFFCWGSSSSSSSSRRRRSSSYDMNGDFLRF